MFLTPAASELVPKGFRRNSGSHGAKHLDDVEIRVGRYNGEASYLSNLEIIRILRFDHRCACVPGIFIYPNIGDHFASSNSAREPSMSEQGSRPANPTENNCR